MTCTLAREFAVYEKHMDALQAYASGKWVVIFQDGIAKICETHQEALDWAYGTYGLNRFFVKQVEPVLPPPRPMDAFDDAAVRRIARHVIAEHIDVLKALKDR